jgi:hypothetical protein
MPKIHDDLNMIFVDLFGVKPSDASSCTMSGTERWDSFSHMSLMLHLEELTGNKEIPMAVIPELISYEKCLSFLIASKKG